MASSDRPITPRATDPGGHEAPGATTTAVDQDLADISFEIPLGSEDMERLSLVELPAIATYGKYELLGRIAYGGMAEIFLAREMGHDDTRRMMIIKRVLPHVAADEHFVAMFRDEARLAMQLNHPNVCHVYSFGEAEGTYFIAMEWVNGKPLSQIIRRARDEGGIPLPIGLKIMAQVAEALDYAHRASDASGEPLGIVHRDVSPQNVMVSYDGVVKLLDFGIAKASSHSARTEAGIIKGKFAYMSPQQCVGEPIDSRADIFALGICLFEVIAGKNPFRRKTEFDTMTKIVGDPTPDVRTRREGVPAAVAAVIETALMKQPERRFQEAGDMQLAIETVIPTLGTIVNASRIGEYVTRLFADDVRDGPQLDTRQTLPDKSTSSDSAPSIDRRPTPPGATALDRSVMPPFAPSERPLPIRRSSGAGIIAWVLATLIVLGGLTAAGAVIAWTIFFDGPDDPVALVAEIPTVEPTPGPVPETPSATTGAVFLESVPPGATIRFGDRENAGTTPIEMGMIAPGTYDVTLRLADHEDWEGRVVVIAGHRATITGELQRRAAHRPVAGPPGQLSVNTRPWSKVYVGHRLLGTTPIGRAAVPSGTLRLRFVDRDGQEHRRSVQVPPGGHVSQSFDLTE